MTASTSVWSHTILQEQKQGPSDWVAAAVGYRDNLTDGWVDRTLSLVLAIPESSVLPAEKAVVIVLGNLLGMALTVFSCPINLPSVPSSQKDVITVSPSDKK